MSTTLGIIIGNRDFFPDHLITEARNEILSIFKNKKINPILLGDNDTKLGGVETFLEAQKCANLFKAHQEQIEGILVILPCLLYTSPSPRDKRQSRMPSSA